MKGSCILLSRWMLVINWMDIFHNLGISVHKCLFWITVLDMWFIAKYFSCSVCMCSFQMCIPEGCFLYLVSVNIFSFYIFCMYLFIFPFGFSFLFVMFHFVLFCLYRSFFFGFSKSLLWYWLCEEYFVMLHCFVLSVVSLYCWILLPRNLMTTHLSLRDGRN